MRGADTFTESLVTMRKLEDFVPLRHPLREILETANAALEKLGPMFTTMYAAEVKGGRQSIAPEKLLRAMLLQVPQVFSKNRERLIEHDAVILFFNEVVAIAHKRGLLQQAAEKPCRFRVPIALLVSR